MTKEETPQHIGIIMDGNGRWAKAKGQPRSFGHREGLESAKAVVKAAADMGIPVISLYIFSTENWKRTQEEVSFLMVLIKNYLRKEFKFYKDNGIKVVHSGDLDGLPQDIQKEIITIQEQTKDFKDSILNLLINYGGKNEITRAVNRHIKKNPHGTISEDIIQNNLDNPSLPPVDLLIRTGGEYRISNFLIWQAAYAELYFSEKLWPEWRGSDLKEAIQSFQKRNRRFGGAKP